jgi:hypothetical protein
LIYEVLKKLQTDMSDLKRTLADHSRQFIGLRQAINDLRGNDLRREQMQAQMDVRLERIEARLSLNDPQH